MRFGFKEVERVLAKANDISNLDRIRFAARLRNLFRVGLAIPKGKGGQRNNYDPESLLKLALAVELMQIGLLPEKIPTAVRLYWANFRALIALVRSVRRKGPGTDAYIFIKTELMMISELDDLQFLEQASFIRGLDKSEMPKFRRATLINVDSVWGAIEDALDAGPLDKSEFLAALDDYDASWMEVDGD